MTFMKNQRQEAILNLVRSRDIFSQAELTHALAEAGFSAAQATVSRDIRELRLVREASPAGLRYVAPGLDAENEPLSRILRDGVVGVDYAGNMLVIKTMSGLAMAAAVVLDDMKIPEILGSVAGDDVVICVVKTEEMAAALAKRLRP